MNLTELQGKGLEGGTLVEYLKGYGFRIEFGRARILRVGFQKDNPTYFEIATNNESHMGVAIDIYGQDLIKQFGAIYLWDSCLGWCYAAAPPGVEIPRPPALDLDYEQLQINP